MHQFPNQESESEAMQNALQPEFDFARRLYNFWLTRKKNQYLAKSGRDELLIDVAMMLNVQACREYRTVVELCKRCEGYAAGIISRSLFETALATGFVLKPEIRIRVVQPDPKKLEYRAVLPKKGTRRNSDILSCEFRALLYLSNMALERNVFKSKVLRKRGRKQYAKSAGVDRKLVAEVERQLGPKWASILNNSNSYSGLSIANLTHAVKYRLDHWYDTVYFFQSRMVHSSAAIHHVKETDSGGSAAQWLSPLKQVRGSLQTGTLMFLIALTILTDQIDFGVATSSGIAAFFRDYPDLFNAEV